MARPPEPNQLLASSLIDTYEKNGPNQRTRIALDLPIEKNIARITIAYLQSISGMESERSFCSALLNSSLALSLFRYGRALARQGSHHEAAEAVP